MHFLMPIFFLEREPPEPLIALTSPPSSAACEPGEARRRRALTRREQTWSALSSGMSKISQQRARAQQPREEVSSRAERNTRGHG
jgi:hypothetical protein